MISCPRCGRENEPGARFCVGCGENLAKLNENGRKDTYVGQVLENKFMILEHLGDGGMGKVYKAEQLTLNKVVAIKILHHNMLQNETQVQRFQREAWSASRLDHPNSIGIIDVGKTADDSHFIAMEYLEGEELSSIIGENKVIDEKRIVKIMSQVLSVLHEAHKNKIIHRDLKPENIMLIKRAEQVDYVKVLDFGIAKLQERDPNMPALTMQGIVCGTPEYMSPEQAMGKELDCRTDIYSAGCILYEMLTGSVPFNANNYQAILGMHIREQARRPSEVKPERNISAKLEEVALVAMQKDRELRFPDAQAMRMALENAIGDAEEVPQAEPKKSKTQVFGGDTGNDLSNILDELPSDSPDGPPPSPLPFNTMEGQAYSEDEAAKPPAASIDDLQGFTLDDVEVKSSSSNSTKILIASLVMIIIAVAVLYAVSYQGKNLSDTEKKQKALEVVKEVENPAKALEEEKAGEIKQQQDSKEPQTKKEAQEKVATVATVKAKKPPKKNSTKKVAVKEKEIALSPIKKQQLALDYYEKGNKAFKEGRIDTAIKNYNTAKTYNPKSPSVYKKLGMAYMKVKQNKKAKSNLQKYLKLAPKARDRHRIKELIEAL